MIMRIQRLNSEQGMALVMVIGIMIVLAISGTAITYYATSNSGQANRSNATQYASAGSDAAIAEALSVIFNSTNNPLNKYLFCQSGETYPCTRTTGLPGGGTISWTPTLDELATPYPQWTITGKGLFKNPAQTRANVSRNVTIKVDVIPKYTKILQNQVWNYVYIYGTGDASACDYSQSNNSVMGSPIYVAGNACFDNQAKVTGGPVQIWGTLTFNNNQNKIGTSSEPVTTGVHIAGGCKLKPATSFHSPCDATDQVYASPAADTTPASLSTPSPAWTTWYVNASPGPYFPCNVAQSGTPPVFDTDQGSLQTADPTKLNRSVAGTFNLTAASYSCKSENGEISYDATNKVLTVNGTVFIDGNGRIDTGGVVTYRGMGTLFLAGSFVLKNTNLCAVASGSSCDWTLGSGHWQPSNCPATDATKDCKFLNIVAGYVGGGGQADVGASDVSAEFISSGYQGGILTAQRFDISTTSSTMGPIVSSRMTVGQSLTTYLFPQLTTVPEGMPDGSQPKFGTPQTPRNFAG
jgi:hypothetical protein